jgi:hypothetical protein
MRMKGKSQIKTATGRCEYVSDIKYAYLVTRAIFETICTKKLKAD